MRTILIALALLVATPAEARRVKPAPAPIHISAAAQIGKAAGIERHTFDERFYAVHFFEPRVTVIKVKPAGRE